MKFRSCRLWAWVLILGGGILMREVSAQAANGVVNQPKKILVVSTTTSWRHESIQELRSMLKELGETTGEFQVLYFDDPEQFVPLKWTLPSGDDSVVESVEAKLTSAWLTSQNIDAVVCASSSGSPKYDVGQIFNWVKNGHAFIALHNAVDNFNNNTDLLSEYCLDHGSSLNGTTKISIADGSNPATVGLSQLLALYNPPSTTTWNISSEEFYHFYPFDMTQVDVLLYGTYDENDVPHTTAPYKQVTNSNDSYIHGALGYYPLSWCKYYGQGRVFCTSLGHRRDLSGPSSVFFGETSGNDDSRANLLETTNEYRTHVLGGIEWALGIKNAPIASLPVAVTANGADNSIGLTWTASPAAVAYNVYRSTSNTGNTTRINSAPITTTNYTDTGVTTAPKGANTYYYNISAIDAGGYENKNFSSGVTGTPHNIAGTTIGSRPQIPTGFGFNVAQRLVTSTRGAPGVTITLQWNSVTGPDILSYKVQPALITVNTSGAPESSNLTAIPVTPASASIQSTTFTIPSNATVGTTYSFVVSVMTKGNSSPPSSEADCTVTSATPHAPTLNSATPGDGQVILKWTAPTDGPTPTSYNIYRSTTGNAADYALYEDSVTGTSYTMTEVNFSQTQLSRGAKYYYEVTAVNGTTESLPSSPQSAVPAPTVPTLVAAQTGNAAVGLTWKGSSAAAGYNIYCAVGTGSYSSTPINSTPVSATSFTATAYTNSPATKLANGKSYSFEVTSVDQNGVESARSQPSLSATPTTNAFPVITNSSGVSAAGAAQSSFSWVGPAGGDYIVDTSTTSGGPYTKMIGSYQVVNNKILSNNITYNTGSGTYTFTDPSKSAFGTTNYYSVSAISNNVQYNSSEISITPTPGPPTLLDAEPVGGAEGGYVNVTFTLPKGAPSGTLYNLKRSDDGGQTYMVVDTDSAYFPNGTITTTDAVNNVSFGSTPIFCLAKDTTSGNYIFTFPDETALPGVSYLYKISALNANGNGESLDSAASLPTTALASEIPDIPTNFQATVQGKEVVLTWSPSMEGTGYIITRVDGNGNSTTISIPLGSNGPAVCSTTDLNIQKGQTYTYTIKAANTVGGIPETSASATATDVTLAPASPGGLTAVGGDGQVALTWPTVPGAISYNVNRLNADGGYFETVATTSDTIYTDKGLSNGVLYTYDVTAANTAGPGDNSPQAIAITVSGGLADPNEFVQWLIDGGFFNVTVDNPDPYIDGATILSTFATTTPDGDQLPVLLKYATGLSLGVPSQNYPTTLGTYTPTNGGASYLTLSFARYNPASIAELTYVVEASTDLNTWTSVATLTGGTVTWSAVGKVQDKPTATTDVNAVTVTDAVAISTNSSAHRYLRLRVTTNTP